MYHQVCSESATWSLNTCIPHFNLLMRVYEFLCYNKWFFRIAYQINISFLQFLETWRLEISYIRTIYVKRGCSIVAFKLSLFKQLWNIPVILIEELLIMHANHHQRWPLVVIHNIFLYFKQMLKRLAIEIYFANTLRFKKIHQCGFSPFIAFSS